MGSVSDQMLSDGFKGPFQAVQGQRVEILTGPDQGKFFTATLLVSPDVTFQGEVLQDNREKVTAHFPDDNFPNVNPEDRMSDNDGQVWQFVKRTNNPQDNTVDWDLMIVVQGVDS